jgi:predicted outer membrane protein
MKAMPILRATFLKIFFLLIILCNTSCNKNNLIESNFKNEAFNTNDQEQMEAYFFIATANLSKAIISKSQIAEQKTSKSIIKQLSRKIENHQNNLLRDIAKIANKRLVIVTEINNSSKLELYKLTDTNAASFDKVYLNSLLESLNEQIEALESVSKETNDEVILKLVLHYLPEMYQLLRETEQIKQQIN